MDPHIKGLRVASAIFAIVAVLQLIRLLSGWEVIINHREIPVWFSGVAVVVLAWLSFWLSRLARQP
jgi:hypothetical protein